jgi:hypothetical protein
LADRPVIGLFDQDLPLLSAKEFSVAAAGSRGVESHIHPLILPRGSLQQGNGAGNLLTKDGDTSPEQ